MSKTIRVTIIASLFFLIYALLYFTIAPPRVLMAMLILSPAILVWLVFTVVTDKKYNTRELKEDEEFSYKDWPDASEKKKNK